MTIKQSSANEKNQKIQRLKSQIKYLLGHKILNEVTGVKQKIEELLIQIDKVKFENKNTKMLTGEITSKEEILTMIIEFSGYTKWKYSSTDILNNREISEIKKRYNVDIIYKYS